MSELLGHRIDAEFYRSDMVENERRIHASLPCKRLADICDRRRTITNGIRGPELAETDFRMLRLQDVDGLWLNSQNALRITQEQYEQNRRAHCVRGDILVAIGGYIGVAGKVVDSSSQTMGQHSALLAINPESADNDFILAFLVSPSGTKLLQRYVSGGVQAGINLEDIREIRVPVPSETVQQAIGNKVRKAERLRELADAALTEAFNSLDQAMGFVPMKSHGRSAWAQSRDFGVSRFDAEYYQPHYLHMDRHLEAWRASRKPISTLRSLMKSGSYGVLPSSDDYGQGDLRFLRAQDVGAFLIEDKEEVLVPRHYANPKAMSREGDLLLEVKGEIAGGAICPKAFEGCLVNGSLYRMTLKEDVDAFYVLALLLSPIGVLQKKRAAANSVISYLSIDFLYDLLIPRLSPEEESNIGQLLRSYTEKVYQARSAIEQAKADVEALISNTLDIDALHAESAAIESWLAANPSPSV